MTYLTVAYRFDAEDRPVEAADAYEEALAGQEAGVNYGTFIDLAVLYFVCNDGGYAAHHSLSQSFLERAWERMFALPTAGVARFAEHPELTFWSSYFAYFWLGGEPFEQQCIELVATGQTLVPYFYLFAFALTDSDIYQSKASELRRQVEAGRTAKERYVLSILDAAFRQRGLRASTQ